MGGPRDRCGSRAPPTPRTHMRDLLEGVLRPRILPWTMGAGAVVAPCLIGRPQPCSRRPSQRRASHQASPPRGATFWGFARLLLLHSTFPFIGGGREQGEKLFARERWSSASLRRIPKGTPSRRNSGWSPTPCPRSTFPPHGKGTRTTRLHFPFSPAGTPLTGPQGHETPYDVASYPYAAIPLSRAWDGPTQRYRNPEMSRGVSSVGPAS